MTTPSNHLPALGATSLATFVALGLLAYAQQDPSVRGAVDEAVTDGRAFANSLGRATRALAAFGRRFGGPHNPTPMG